MGKNPEREKVLDFSEAYAPFFNGVFGPAGIAVKSAADLAGKTVGVTRGAVEDLELSKIAPASANIKRYEDNNATISAFLSGQVQLIATGNVVASTLIAKHPPKAPETKFLIKNSPCFIGMNKGEKSLQDKVNAILADAKKDGSLNTLSIKWLLRPLPAQLTVPLHVLKTFLADMRSPFPANCGSRRFSSHHALLLGARPLMPCRPPASPTAPCPLRA